MCFLDYFRSPSSNLAASSPDFSYSISSLQPDWAPRQLLIFLIILVPRPKPFHGPSWGLHSINCFARPRKMWPVSSSLGFFFFFHSQFCVPYFIPSFPSLRQAGIPLKSHLLLKQFVFPPPFSVLLKSSLGSSIIFMTIKRSWHQKVEKFPS